MIIKNMINECDFQINASENEIILNHYKSQLEPIEIKFCNNNSIRLHEVI